MRPFRRAFVCVAALGALLLSMEAGRAASVTEEREAAVREARAGHASQAQAALRALLAAGREDGFVAMDLATLLQQDGKAAEAVAVFETAARGDPPDYALLSVTRAYRDLGRYVDAERTARQGLSRFGGEPVWALLLSLILSDAGKTTEALAVLAAPPATAAPPVERTMAEAYAWRRAGDPTRALRLYQQAVEMAPASQGPRGEGAAVLQGMGAPYGAAQIVPLDMPLEADEAAAMVRWGSETRSSDPARRFEGTDAALARIDRLLASLPAADQSPRQAALRRKLRLDRLVALRDRVRMAEAAREGDALSAEAPLPPYAEQAYADALLYLKRPAEAREAYRRVLAVTPKDVQARYGVFYASSDLDDFTTAYATIDALVADEPVWRFYRNDATRYANADRQYAEVTAAQARFYGNQLGDAWARITRLSEAAPADGHARLALYQIANARGWPQRAREEAEIAASLAPLELESCLALVETAIADHRYAHAQRLMDELVAQYPEDQSVRRLARELDAKKRWLFEAEAKPGNSDGGGANASGRTLELQGKLTSPPIADNWRLFAMANYANANPPEGYVQRTRAGGGIDWSAADIDVSAFVAPSWGTIARTGAGAEIDWVATDQLRFAVAAELFSWETPLRALLYGITADQVSAKAMWRWNESRSVTGSFAYMPFTDGNQRAAAGLTYRDKVLNLPGFDLTALAEGYLSTNTQPNAPYYNPTRDLALTGGLMAEQLLWHAADTSLRHTLTVDGGLYSEYGYADAWIGTIRYQQRWRFDPLTELHYGVELTRRSYDGSIENAIALVIGLSQRI